MKDIRSMLRDGDPITREGDLSPVDTEKMRSQLRSAGSLAPPARRRSLAPLAAALVLLTVSAVWIAHSVAPQEPTQALTSSVDRQESVGVRQLQFVTAGGTRVFWTFLPKTGAR